MHLLLVLSLIFAGASAVTRSAPAPAALEPLTIETAIGGKHVFRVEIVREEKERDRGLMFRQELATDAGMLFDYNPPQQVSFWMKNTFIPLDIVFIGADGRILNIAANTTPLSLENLPSKGPVRGVLEVNGGLCAKLGIGAGDLVRHAMFGTAKP